LGKHRKRALPKRKQIKNGNKNELKGKNEIKGRRNKGAKGERKEVGHRILHLAQL